MTSKQQPGMVFRVTSTFNPKLLVAAHKRVANHCNRHTMEYHGRVHLPDHFKPGAGQKYGYKPRRSVIGLKFLYRTNRAAYDKVKKLKGPNGRTQNRGLYKDVKAASGLDPLEWSGQTRRMVTNPFNRKVTATSTRGRLVVRTPNYVSSRLKSNKGGKARQMQAQALERSAELEVMTAGEIRTLRKVFGDEYVAAQKPGHPKAAQLKIQLRQRSRRKR